MFTPASAAKGATGRANATAGVVETTNHARSADRRRIARMGAWCGGAAFCVEPA